MNPKNVSTGNTTTAVAALGATVALAAGAVAYYQSRRETKTDIEKYNARVCELANLRRGHLVLPDAKTSEADIDRALREFRTNVAAQLRCYLGIKMPGNLEAATKFGFTGGVKSELRESSNGQGVFVKEGSSSIVPGELVACVGGRVYTSNTITNLKCIAAGTGLGTSPPNTVRFISKTGSEIFTINPEEEPEFEVKDEVAEISLGGRIRLATGDEQANVFLYGPTTSRKGTPNENMLPCGYASECFGTDEVLAFPPVVAAIALREIGPNEELLIDTRIGVAEDDWFQDIFSINDRIAAKMRRVASTVSNVSTASTAPTPRRVMS